MVPNLLNRALIRTRIARPFGRPSRMFLIRCRFWPDRFVPRNRLLDTVEHVPQGGDCEAAQAAAETRYCRCL
jgi:hypothetical protein